MTGPGRPIATAALGHRREAGAEPVGYKLGFTNAAIQDQYGVDEPAHGCLLDDAMLDGEVVRTADLIAPRVEPELPVVLDEPLAGACAVHEVLAATRAVVPVVEVVDSRTAGEPSGWPTAASASRPANWSRPAR